jgi:hypothetical protein
MFNRYFIITVAFIGALIAGMVFSQRVLVTHSGDSGAVYQVAEASDDSAEGEEGSEFC